jgi:glycosyltransferase involved in cell wall biosynthesis
MNVSRKKKVLIFLVWYGMGGSTIYISQYVSYLVSNNYKVYIVCRKRDKGSNYLKDLGANPIYVHFPFALNFTALDEFNNSLKKHIIDIIKLFGGFFLSLSLLLIYRPNIVIIGEFNEIPVLLSSSLFRNKTICLFQTSISKKNWKRFILFKLLKKINHLVGITDLHAEEIPLKDKLLIIPNIYIDFDLRGANNIIENLEIGNNQIILFVGGISRIKGTIHFIKLALELLKLRNDISFIILGRYHKRFKTKYAIGIDDSDFTYNEEIFKIIGNYLDTKFKFLGEVDNVGQIMKQAALLINTNIYPHFSRPIVEAWANKVPVISHEDEFTRNMSHHNDSIKFIEVGKYEKNANVIKDLLNNKIEKDQLIRAGYYNYLNYYSLDSIKEKLHIIFNE